MHTRGNLLKMKSRYDENDISKTVEYQLPVGPDLIAMNELIDHEVRFEYTGQINCIHCGRETNKSFAQGYCYPCFISLPQTDQCILRPEKCQAHLGISRDMEWSEKNCLQDHFVYLALSPGLKVGVTRKSQVPTRWIDQGAWKAIKLAIAPNRYTAGTLEVELKKNFSDKTNWRHMLAGMVIEEINLEKEKEKAHSLLPEGMTGYLSDDNTIYSFKYPVEKYPEKVKPLNFDREKTVEGVLAGIKGQYLIFNEGSVLNIRKFGGYQVDFYF